MFSLLITQEFVPITTTAGEILPAAPLVVTAYGFAWLVIFVYVWSIWRRLDRVDRELASAIDRIAERAT